MDLLVRGGTLVTMDPKRRVLRGDLLIRDGRIERLGPRALRGDRPPRILDARGCAVVPGLIQAHVHLCQALFRGMADDLPLLAWLKKRIWPLEAAHDPKSLRASARLGIAEMTLAGTTTILDMGTVHHHDVVFEELERSGMRAASGKAMMDRGAGVPRGLRETRKDSLAESERLCDRWHGAAGGRLRYAFAPRFILSCSERLFRDTVALAEERDAIVHSHVAEHAEERRAVKEALGKDDVAALAAYGVRGPRAVLAHAVQLRDAEMKRIGRDGTRLVHCPSANLKLASGIARVRPMRDAGIVVGLGHDGAPCNNRMDPWTELRQAALLAKVVDGDAASLKAAEALALATIDGAKVLGIDDEVGSLEVGKRADVAVVELDGPHCLPGGDEVTRLVYSATAADVRHVVVDGEILVKDRAHQTLDIERVRHDAVRQGKRVAQRAGL